MKKTTYIADIHTRVVRSTRTEQQINYVLSYDGCRELTEFLRPFVQAGKICGFSTKDDSNNRIFEISFNGEADEKTWKIIYKYFQQNKDRWQFKPIISEIADDKKHLS